MFAQRPRELTARISSKRFELCDLRVQATRARSSGWQDTGVWEPAVSVTLVQLALPSEAFKAVLCVSFSMHAMSRFFQRAFRANDEALVAAIWHVCDVGLTRSEDVGDDVKVPAPVANGGHWYGKVHAVKEAGADYIHRFIAVRTFHTFDDR